MARGELADAPLVEAAARQDWQRVQSLLDEGAVVNAPRAEV